MIRRIAIGVSGCSLLAHPESPEEMIDRADAVGSTTQLINAVARLQILVYSSHDKGILQNATAGPREVLIAAPTRRRWDLPKLRALSVDGDE